MHPEPRHICGCTCKLHVRILIKMRTTLTSVYTSHNLCNTILFKYSASCPKHCFRGIDANFLLGRAHTAGHHYDADTHVIKCYISIPYRSVPFGVHLSCQAVPTCQTSTTMSNHPLNTPQMHPIICANLNTILVLKQVRLPCPFYTVHAAVRVVPLSC